MSGTSKRAPGPPVAVNSAPHPDGIGFNERLDALEPDVYVAFFQSHPKTLTPAFIDLMRATSRPPDGAFETVEVSVARAFGKDATKQRWQSAIRPVAEPLCRFAGFTQKPAIVRGGAWMNILMNEVMIDGRWHVRMRPSLDAALVALDILPRLSVKPDAVISDERRQAEILRAAGLVLERIRLSGREVVLTRPMRTRLVTGDYVATVETVLQRQKECCALCGAPIDLTGRNRLLQLSIDRIDNASGSYDLGNVQATHLGCNLARNLSGLDDFAMWLDAIKGGNWPASVVPP